MKYIHSVKLSFCIQENVSGDEWAGECMKTEATANAAIAGNGVRLITLEGEST